MYTCTYVPSSMRPRSRTAAYVTVCDGLMPENRPKAEPRWARGPRLNGWIEISVN